MMICCFYFFFFVKKKWRCDFFFFSSRRRHTRWNCDWSSDVCSSDLRGFALGCNAVVIALGSSMGPTLGGIITEHWSWRWIFYVNLPIGICGLLGSQKVLRRTVGIKQRFDPIGAALLAAGFATLTLALSFVPEWGWSSWRSVFCFGVGLAALLAVPVVER